MHIYLVRHAIAEDRESWRDNDGFRPLTSAGRRQARQLADVMAAEHVGRIISSPSLRCLETVAQIAVARGIGIEADGRLAETGDPRELVNWMHGIDGESVVMASHGEPIGSAIALMAQRGVPVDGPMRCKKASTWVITVDQGAVTHLRYSPPPEA